MINVDSTLSLFVPILVGAYTSNGVGANINPAYKGKFLVGARCGFYVSGQRMEFIGNASNWTLHMDTLFATDPRRWSANFINDPVFMFPDKPQIVDDDPLVTLYWGTSVPNTYTQPIEMFVDVHLFIADDKNDLVFDVPSITKFLSL